eukprot:gene28307-35065_t
MQRAVAMFKSDVTEATKSAIALRNQRWNDLERLFSSSSVAMPRAEDDPPADQDGPDLENEPEDEAGASLESEPASEEAPSPPPPEEDIAEAGPPSSEPELEAEPEAEAEPAGQLKATAQPPETLAKLRQELKMMHRAMNALRQEEHGSEEEEEEEAGAPIGPRGDPDVYDPEEAKDTEDSPNTAPGSDKRWKKRAAKLVIQKRVFKSEKTSKEHAEKPEKTPKGWKKQVVAASMGSKAAGAISERRRTRVGSVTLTKDIAEKLKNKNLEQREAELERQLAKMEEERTSMKEERKEVSRLKTKLRELQEDAAQRQTSFSEIQAENEELRSVISDLDAKRANEGAKAEEEKWMRNSFPEKPIPFQEKEVLNEALHHENSSSQPDDEVEEHEEPPEAGISVMEKFKSASLNSQLREKEAMITTLLAMKSKYEQVLESKTHYTDTAFTQTSRQDWASDEEDEDPEVGA